MVFLGIAWLWNSESLPGKSASPNAILKGSLAEGKPVVLFFYSHDCKQCELMKEPIRQVRDEFSNSVTILEVDVNDLHHQSLIRRIGIFAVPTLAFYKRDGSKQLFVGAMDKDKLRNRVMALEDNSLTTR